MVEAQYSLVVVLPESTALAEIISSIRQKGVLIELNRHRGVFPRIFPPKKGNSEKSCDVYCRVSISFLGVPLFGAQIGGCTPFLAKHPFSFFFIFSSVFLQWSVHYLYLIVTS